MSQTNRKLSVWRRRVVVLSLLLFFFAIPHTLEDFALGEPAENGVPAQVLALVVAGLFALQGLALFWAGQGRRRNYFIHAGLGLIWPLAAGMAQLPVILTASNYRSGFISISYVAGMIVIGILLFLASLQALRAGSQAKKEAVPGNTSGFEGNKR
jgi:hypothetical protein